MLYLLAIVALVALTALFWRAFGPQGLGSPKTGARGPDDDPDFLRTLGPGASPPRD